MCRKKLPNVSHCATKSSPLQAEAPTPARRTRQQAPDPSQTRPPALTYAIHTLNTHIHDANE